MKTIVTVVLIIMFGMIFAGMIPMRYTDTQQFKTKLDSAGFVVSKESLDLYGDLRMYQVLLRTTAWQNWQKIILSENIVEIMREAARRSGIVPNF